MWVVMGSAAGCGWGGGAGVALAAVLGQKGQQCVHLREVGAVDQAAALALLRQQPGLHQLLKVKRQRGRRYLLRL